MLRLLLAAFVFLYPQHARAQAWPNEPAGSTTVLDCEFDSISGCGITDVYNSIPIVSDPTAPTSPANTAQITLPARATEGGGQLIYNYGGPYREVFVGLTWRTNAQFDGRPVGNKLWFMLGPEVGGVFLYTGLDTYALQNGVGQILWGTNSLAYDNSHICVGGLVCYPNVATVPVPVGSWAKIEIYFKSSTTATSRDGIFRWWVNGVLSGDYTTANYAPAGYYEWQFNSTWDSCGGNPACDLGKVNTQDWTHVIDHLYISIPNCPNGCPVTGNKGGGGTIPKPPPWPEAEGCPPVPDIKLRSPQNSTSAIDLGKICKNGYEIFGLPPGCGLSAGTYDASRDTWDLTAADARGLSVTCPGACGKMEFTVIPKNDP